MLSSTDHYRSVLMVEHLMLHMHCLVFSLIIELVSIGFICLYCFILRVRVLFSFVLYELRFLIVKKILVYRFLEF